jgi:hypothetical protein
MLPVFKPARREHPRPSAAASRTITSRVTTAFAGAAGLLAAACIATTASAHEARYLYEASATNRYEATNPGGQADYRSGEVPQAAFVEGAGAYAAAFNGGTVFVGAELPGMDPLALRNVEYAGGQGYLSYNLWIDGPDPDALVPVRFIGGGSVTSNSSRASGQALLRLGEVGLGGQVRQWQVAGQGDDETGVSQEVAFFDVDETIYMKPSMTYFIEMLAGAGVQAAVFDGAHATATVDPTFTILGDFALSYRVVGVPGGPAIPGGGGAVPEPATWAMMVVGFGLLGGSLRRRRFVTATAA